MASREPTDKGNGHRSVGTSRRGHAGGDALMAAVDTDPIALQMQALGFLEYVFPQVPPSVARAIVAALTAGNDVGSALADLWPTAVEMTRHVLNRDTERAKAIMRDTMATSGALSHHTVRTHAAGDAAALMGGGRARASSESSSTKGRMVKFRPKDAACNGHSHSSDNSENDHSEPASQASSGSMRSSPHDGRRGSSGSASGTYPHPYRHGRQRTASRGSSGGGGGDADCADDRTTSPMTTTSARRPHPHQHASHSPHRRYSDHRHGRESGGGGGTSSGVGITHGRAGHNHPPPLPMRTDPPGAPLAWWLSLGGPDDLADGTAGGVGARARDEYRGGQQRRGIRTRTMSAPASSGLVERYPNGHHSEHGLYNDAEQTDGVMAGGTGRNVGLMHPMQRHVNDEPARQDVGHDDNAVVVMAPTRARTQHRTAGRNGGGDYRPLSPRVSVRSPSSSTARVSPSSNSESVNVLGGMGTGTGTPPDDPTAPHPLLQHGHSPQRVLLSPNGFASIYDPEQGVVEMSYPRVTQMITNTTPQGWQTMQPSLRH
eukprot:m.60195 g.60195  ORF g.60195 m.60195 type:complete len:545 (+) comp7942_c0_seq2:149-1783(+)